VAYVPGQAYPPQPGLPAPSWLAGTADRERAAGILRAGFTEGRLSQDELDERIGRAYAARTYAQLWAVTSDLPAGSYPGPHLTGYGPPPVAVMPPDSSLVVPPDGGNWQSAAALLLTALVIFTLAALVTAIVTAHVQPGLVSPGQQQGVITPFHQVQLTPYIKLSGPGIVAGPLVPGTHH
jgi:hypothetical protein